MTSSAIAEISAEIDKALFPLLDGFEEYALLDFPNHTNIGDSCIYAGELAVLDRYFGHSANVVTTHHSPVLALKTALPEGVLLLHGGGNFGDLWLRHQRYREKVLTTCTDQKVIQMPQSIHFGDEKQRDRAARAISAHPDFTLLVRDRQSLAIAEAHFDCETILCPDMAFGLAPVTPPDVRIKHKTLCLMRADHERGEGIDPQAFAALGHLEDWPVDSDLVSLPGRAAIRFTNDVSAPGALMRFRERFFRRHAVGLTNRGFAMLNSAERVVTDRLHGHILSSLLGKPHIVLDNLYGKITTFIDAWPKDPYTTRVKTLEEARAALEAL